jgi:hypothetical protein
VSACRQCHGRVDGRRSQSSGRPESSGRSQSSGHRRGSVFFHGTPFDGAAGSPQDGRQWDPTAMDPPTTPGATAGPTCMGHPTTPGVPEAQDGRKVGMGGELPFLARGPDPRQWLPLMDFPNG